MGSTAASSTCLKAILRLQPRLKVVGLVTQPDRPAGRHRALTPCPCKAYANENGIKDCITPENVNSPEALAQIKAWNPDVIVVVAFGQFLGKTLLELPPLGCVNCHFSLLPRHRGASPVNAAIAAGDNLSGASVIKIGEGMDDGPVYRQTVEPIYSDDNSETLMDRLAITGAVALAATLKQMEAGRQPPPVPQVQEEATYAHKMKRADGLIDWSAQSRVIERKFRAFQPWPGVFTFLPRRMRKANSMGRLVIGSLEFLEEGAWNPAWRAELPGTVLAATDRGPIVKTGDTGLLLTALQPEGGRMLAGREFLHGRALKPLADMLGA